MISVFSSLFRYLKQLYFVTLKKTNKNRKRFKHENRVSPSVCVFEFWACVCENHHQRIVYHTHTITWDSRRKKKFFLLRWSRYIQEKESERVKVKNYYQIKRCYMWIKCILWILYAAVVVIIDEMVIKKPVPKHHNHLTLSLKKL